MLYPEILGPFKRHIEEGPLRGKIIMGDWSRPEFELLKDLRWEWTEKVNGTNVRLYQLIAFILAGGFAGLAGGLFGIFNRGVFPDFCYWPKSAEVLIMTILGGIHSFWGPSVGAAILILLNQYIVSYTEYWPFVLGTILLVLLFGFPGGVVGAIEDLFRRLRSAAGGRR